MNSPLDIPESSMNEFLTECEEVSARVSLGFAAVEKGDHGLELIDRLYRDIHSLKGSAQLFGFRQLCELAHTMESSLDPIRRREASPSKNLMNILFKCVDLIDRLIVAYRRKHMPDCSAELQILIPNLIQASVGAVAGDHPVSNEVPKLVESAPVNAPSGPSAASPVPQTSPPVPASAPAGGGGASGPNASASSSEENSSIRVPVALLDSLMTLMGEMVLVRNQVLQYSNNSDDLEFLNLSQRLNVVTSEIQGEMMKTRMQPIGNILTKFHRVIRDLSKELGKKVELQLSGTETELDKTLLEAVKDPLTHIIRNSCDHGIESPEDRRKAGKPESGTIAVRAFHEGGQVIVEVADDGKGLYRDKLIAKAIEKGLIQAEKAPSMSDREVFELIFAPGFSTAATITNVSGRGVGMDVVRSNIDKIGGVVELQSESGRGTTIRLKIPLTLAIVPAMVIRCEQEFYAIPQVKLVELVRVDPSDSENKIEYLQGKPVFRLRGNLLPLMDLKEVLGFGGAKGRRSESEVVNIVVLNAERQFFGLIVDEIQDTADIVVKPLNRFLKSLSVYSGATVLGDGAVALILDVPGIAAQQNLVSDRKNEAGAENAFSLDGRIKSLDAQEFLLFRANSPTKHAILLNYVHRLEEFRRDSVEISGAQRVVRYRDSILPIVSLNESLGLGASAEGPSNGKPSDEISVIVTKRGDRFFGIEVNEILDVLSTEAFVDDSVSDRPGILGNLVTDQEVVVVVDPQKVLQPLTGRVSSIKGGDLGAGDPACSMAVPGAILGTVPGLLDELSQITQQSLRPEMQTRPSAPEPFARSRTSKRILLVEDTPFFRRHVTSVLQRAGHVVSTANDGQEALDLLDQAGSGSFDLILSDIEMPRVNGMQLAEAVRKDRRWGQVSMIALTTRSDHRSVEEGLRAGFNLYMEKMNPEELLKAIDGLNPGTRRGVA